MMIRWTGLGTALCLVLAGQAQAAQAPVSYVSLDGIASALPPVGANRNLEVTYNSRIGSSVLDSHPSSGGATYSAPVVLGLNAAAISGALSPGLNGSNASFTLSASLPDGTLHAYAASGASYAPDNGATFASAVMVDQLHFTVLGPDPAFVTFTAHVDGAIALAGDPADANAGWSDQIGLGAATFIYRGGETFDGASEVTYGTYLDGAQADTRTGWYSTASSNDTYTGHDFSGVLQVSNGDTLDFYHRLFVQCVGGVCDFGHTASVGFLLPQDVSFSSNSGVFLAGPGVPEPADWVLMITGLGLTGTALRRRRPSADKGVLSGEHAR